MIVAFYYEKARLVTLMKKYAGLPFCNYQNVTDVCALCGGSGNVWRITLEDGSKVYVTCDIMEVRRWDGSARRVLFFPRRSIPAVYTLKWNNLKRRNRKSGTISKWQKGFSRREYHRKRYGCIRW